MLRYSLRELRRSPRRVLAAILGVALGVGLFAAILLFVDTSAASMTARAVAPVPVDMYAQLSAPLASPLRLAEAIAAPPSLATGERATVTLNVVDDGSAPAEDVVVRDEPPPPLTYVPGSTTLNGTAVPDGEDGRSALEPGLAVGTMAPRTTDTITYTVSAPARGVPVVRALSLGGTAVSRGDPDPATANAPGRVTLEDVRAQIGRIGGVESADRLAIVDLPGGSLRANGVTLPNPVRVFGFDPGYAAHHHDVRVTAGSQAAGSALLSGEASKALGVAPGADVELTVPGGAQPVALRIGGVADLSGAGSLFASRSPDTLGDFIYVPDSIVVDSDVFEAAIVPALRADATATERVVKRPPIMEVDVRLDHSRLNANPATALVRTEALTRTVDRVAPGQAVVIDNLSATLAAARSDAVAGIVMFLFLGLPGVLLAGFLAAYAGGLLATALRREHAILRTRGAQPGHLVRLVAYRTVAVAGVGSLLGLGLGFLAVVATQGSGALSVVPMRDLVLVSLIAVGAGVVTTALALYVPGRRALSKEVTEEGRELASVARPLWQRMWLDVALLAGAALVETVTYLAGGFTPTQAEASEGQAVSLSFYILLAPLMAWFGASLLAARLLGVLSPPADRRSTSAGFGPLVRGALRRSVRRRSRVLSAGVVGVSLALAFGFSVAIFIATYDAEKAADARFVVGSDLRVTPSALSPQPSSFADRLRVPGVVSATPVHFHIGNALFGGDTKDMAAIDPAGFARTATPPDAFFVDGTAAAVLAALRADPAGLLVDQEMARDFNIQVGDPVKVKLTDVSGTQVTVTFHAVGRFTHFPGFPQNADVVANLGLFERMTGITTADMFLVRAADPGDAGVARVAAALQAGPGREVPLRVETTATTVNKDQSTLAALNLHGLGTLDSVFIALMSATAIGIFVLGLLLQRRREYITLRALGMRMVQLQALLVGEAGVVALCSLVIGAGVGTGMALLFVQVLRPLFTLPVGRLTFPAASMLGLAGLVLGVMLVASLATSLVIRRLSPMELLREQ